MASIDSTSASKTDKAATATTGSAPMSKAIEETIRNIAHRWDGTNRSTLRRVIPVLVNGAPMPVADLAAMTHTSIGEIERQLELSGADRDDAGDITALGGVSLSDGAFRLSGSGIDVRSCCALVAHAVSIISGKEIEVDTIDPVDASTISLSLAPHGVLSSIPAPACATFVRLDALQGREGLFDRFCQFVRYFGSSSTAVRFPTGDRGSAILSPHEVHVAAALWVRVVWGVE